MWQSRPLSQVSQKPHAREAGCGAFLASNQYWGGLCDGICATKDFTSVKGRDVSF